MSENLRRSFVFLAWSAAAISTLLAFRPATGHDQPWFLLTARRWLAGDALYGPMALDSNPHFVVWLSAVPVMLAGPLRIAATVAAKSLVLLGTAAIAAVSNRLLPQLWDGAAETCGRPATNLVSPHPELIEGKEICLPRHEPSPHKPIPTTRWLEYLVLSLSAAIYISRYPSLRPAIFHFRAIHLPLGRPGWPSIPSVQ